MKYYYIKDRKKYEFNSLIVAVKSYTNESIFYAVNEKIKNIENKQYPINLTKILSKEVEKKSHNRKFSYQGKIFDTAKECYDYFGVPNQLRYKTKYRQAIKSDNEIIALDEAIDYTPQHRENKSFNDAVKEIQKWYFNNKKDPCITSDKIEERKLANKIQNFRKAYKNYEYEQKGLPRQTNHYINENQISQLNEIGFVWKRRTKKKKA